MSGYGREWMTDRLGTKVHGQAGYNPESIGHVFEMFQAGERFERQRAAAEGREPRLYPGVFRAIKSGSARGAGGRARATSGRAARRLDRTSRQYLTTINGIAYGSSKAGHRA
jgi:predicted Zn-dependent protease